MRRIAALAAVLGAMLAFPTPPHAQEIAATRLELNRLEPQGENCRAYLMIDNARAKRSYRSLKLDLFALDTDGVAARRLAVELGPIAANKTVIKLFDFTGLACPRFGRLLLNDVMACEAEPAAGADCLAAIETTSKTIPFIR